MSLFGGSKELRSTIFDDEFSGFRIIIPSTMSWFQAIFYSMWLYGWLILEIYCSIRVIYGTDKAPAIFWMIVFTVAGVFAIGGLCWSLFGREVIIINEKWLELHWHLGRLGWMRPFERSFIQGLRFAPDPRIRFPDRGSTGDFFRRLGLGGTTIAFDYGSKTYRFGQCLSEDEVRRLIRTIRQRFPFPEDLELESLPIQY